MAKQNLMHGTRTPKLKYKQVALGDIVGKTVQGVTRTTVQGENGNEPCIILLFTDGTSHGFVLPRDSCDK